jgi:hypothetical protein
MRPGRAIYLQRAEQVNVQLALEVGTRIFLNDRLAADRARIVHDNVDPPEPRYRLIDQIPRVGIDADSSGKRDSRAARRLDLGYDCLGLAEPFVQFIDDDRCPAFGKQPRMRPSEAAAGARDERNPSIEA